MTQPISSGVKKEGAIESKKGLSVTELQGDSKQATLGVGHKPKISRCPSVKLDSDILKK